MTRIDIHKLSQKFTVRRLAEDDVNMIYEFCKKNQLYYQILNQKVSKESIINDMNYYNGIVFRGFAEGVPDSVLSGGQYDRLMRQMGRRGGAVGFAVYLDRLGRMPEAAREYDVDTLLLYDEGCDLAALYAAAATLQAAGSVMLQKEIPEKLTYRQLYRFSNGEVNPQ